MVAFKLTGKTAVITGGGSGIGFGIAKVFVEAGASVIIIGQNKKKLSDAQTTLGGKCHQIAFDISNLNKIPELVLEIETKFGPVDILVNCAGVHLKKFALETSDEEFLSVLNVNLLSVFALTREFSKAMVKRMQGSIILISSLSSIIGMKQVVAYSTGKTAILGMMRSMVAELAIDNIRINTIAPGWIETPMLFKAIENDEPRRQKIFNRIPNSKFGLPEDIGYAALYLASDASRYVNGVFLPVDAGAIGGF